MEIIILLLTLLARPFFSAKNSSAYLISRSIFLFFFLLFSKKFNIECLFSATLQEVRWAVEEKLNLNVTYKPRPNIIFL